MSTDMIITVYLVYGTFSIVVIIYTVLHAQKNNKNPLIYGGVACFLVSTLMFWELIPCRYVFTHYKEKSSGLVIYKQPSKRGSEEALGEKFFKEQVGNPYWSFRQKDLLQTMLSDQIMWSFTICKCPFLPVYCEEERLIDVVHNEVLAKRVRFRSGYQNSWLGTVKVWLNHRQKLMNVEEFDELLFKYIGKP